MPTSFRSLEIWQLAHSLSTKIYETTRLFPKEEQFGLINQMRRASVSVSANIAESCGRYRMKDKVQLLIVARGSIYEMRSHASIALDLKYIAQSVFNEFDGQYELLLRKLNAFISTLRNSPHAN